MTNIVFSPTGPLIRGKTAAEDFFLEAEQADELVGTTTPGSVVVRDRTYSTVIPQTTVAKSNIRVNSLPEIAPTFESATPSVCTVSPAGAVTKVSDGVCGVIVRANGDARRIDRPITTTPGTLAYTGVAAFGANSLRKHLWDQQLACFSGLTPGATTQRAFSGSGVNASCLVRRTVSGYQRPPLDALDQLLVGAGGPATDFHPWRAWITPHHYITWLGHFTGAPTATQRWVQEMCITYSATAWTGALCKFLPANVSTAKLPPETYPMNLIGSYIAAWARLTNVYTGDGDRYWVQPVNLGNGSPVPADDPRRPWQRLNEGGVMATGGDSGSPIWTQINGELVILCHVVLYGVAGGGGFGQGPYHTHITEINAALAALNASGTYTVQTVDLSGFGNF